VSSATAWASREGENYPYLKPHLRIEKPVPHDQIVARYRSADGLVLCALDPLSTPGKLYEYIAAGPPVLAFVVPGTDTELLLAQTGAGEAVPAVGDAAVELGAQAIERAYDRFRNGERQKRDPSAIEALTRRSQVAEIVALFNRLTGAADRASGAGGADRASGAGGADRASGAGGADRASGAGGADRASGAGGADRASGAGGPRPPADRSW
jgi:hypothetical protein